MDWISRPNSTFAVRSIERTNSKIASGKRKAVSKKMVSASGFAKFHVYRKSSASISCRLSNLLKPWRDKPACRAALAMTPLCFLSIAVR